MIRQKICGVFERYPEVAAVYLFGSHANGTARPDSDYDLAVVETTGMSARRRRLDILADLARNGLSDVDLTFLDGHKRVLEHEAVRMNQIVFRRPAFNHASFYSRVMRMYFDTLPLLNIQRQAMKERLIHGTA